MRKFAITVNGQAYEVEVEEIGGAPTFAAAPARIILIHPSGPQTQFRILHSAFRIQNKIA